ncbi:hypothetical protein RCL1_006237 [Eukaryota sp. TZLM3-RCL]
MRKLYASIALSCLSSLMFGYVLSSLNIPLLDNNKPGFIGYDIPELKDATNKQIATSASIIAAMISSFITSFFADKYGRRFVLLFNDVFYISGAIISAYFTNFSLFCVGRFLSGFGVGVSSIVVPLITSEISTTQVRGFAAVATQLGVVSGILSAVVIGFFASNLAHGWRVSVGFLAIPAIIQLFCFKIIPESPRWIAGKTVKFDKEGDLKEKLLSCLNGIRPVNHDFEEEINQLMMSSRQSKSTSGFKLKGCFKPLFIGIFLNLVQQFSGINAVIYYSSQIFESAGFHGLEDVATVITMGVNFISTIVAIYLVDKLGRKSLLLTGLSGQLFSLLVLSFASIIAIPESNLFILINLIGMFAYIACFAIGAGAVLWPIITEVFPDKSRASGVSICLFVNWTCNLVISLFFLSVVEYFNYNLSPIFNSFAGVCVVGIVGVVMFIPETKGKKFEAIAELLGINKADEEAGLLV